jgi:subtilisin family serine protease
MNGTAWLKAIALVLSAGITGTGAAQADEDYADYGTTRGWSILAISNDGGFTRCAGVSDSFPFTLELSAEGWMLTIDGPLDNPPEVPAIADVDRYSFEGTFYPLANGRYGMFMEDGMVEAMQAGDRLLVSFGGEITEASLAGSTAAMLKIGECVERGGVPPRGGAIGQGRAAPPVESDAARLGDGCPAYGAYASPASDVPARVRFYNASDIAVSLYWIGFDGQIVEYAGTLPGESYELDSYVGHYWLAKDFDGTCHEGVMEVTDGMNDFEIH